MAGNFHGFNEGIKSHTRSGLLFEIEKLVKKLKGHKLIEGKVIPNSSKTKDGIIPKFLLLENVVNLVRAKHKPDFDNWLNELKKMNYKTIWGIIDSSDFGMIQARKRVFALSIHDPENEIEWEVSDNLNEKLTEIYNQKKYVPQKQKIDKVLDFENTHFQESLLSQIKNTPSRLMMIEKGKDLNSRLVKNISTITTKQDRWPNPGYLSFKHKRKDKYGTSYLDKRFLTPRETYKLMGFTDKEFKKAKKANENFAISQTNARDKLYRQAGNSIPVSVLEMIFYFLAKGDYNE